MVVMLWILVVVQNLAVQFKPPTLLASLQCWRLQHTTNYTSNSSSTSSPPSNRTKLKPTRPVTCKEAFVNREWKHQRLQTHKQSFNYPQTVNINYQAFSTSKQIAKSHLVHYNFHICFSFQICFCAKWKCFAWLRLALFHFLCIFQNVFEKKVKNISKYSMIK
jgi:hypothetical protein